MPRRISPSTQGTDCISSRAVTASAMFGITAPSISGPPRGQADYQNAAHELDFQLQPGQIALITGPSGGGKSSILRALAELTHPRSLLVNSIADQSLIALSGCKDAPSRSIVDLFGFSLDHTLSLLAGVGLAEASLFARSFQTLSDGQKHRLFLALSLASPCSHSTIIIDEFCSVLDRLSSRAIAESISKRLRSESIHNASGKRKPRLVVATAHDDLFDHLQPDVLLHVPLGPSLSSPIQIMELQQATRLSRD